MTHHNETGNLQQEAVNWMLRFKTGLATRDEVAAFGEWCCQDAAHAKAFADMRGLWDAVGQAGKPLFDPKALDELAAERVAQSALLGRRAFLTGAIAASAAGAAYAAIHPPLNLWPSLAEMTADYRTATGEQRQVALASDIAIDMNTQTSIRLRPVADDAERIELISGEGLVKSSSRALEVMAGPGNARAANAVFNIRRDGDKVIVTCVEGQVRVVCRSSSVDLTSSRQVSYTEVGLGSVLQTELLSITSWRDGFLVFHNVRLADVIAEINRYRPGRIIVMNATLAQRPVDGRFYLARLNEVVEKFENAFSAHVTRLPGGVVILS
jgi:transmembrane sensor